MIFGVKESSFINKIVTLFNLSVIGLIIVLGAIKSNPENWSLKWDTQVNSVNLSVLYIYI
jgi:amino acid transporter